MSVMPPALRARVRARHAFTIVEVVMTVFVLALVLTTALTTLQRAFCDLDHARNIEIAGRILQSEIEKERLLPWGEVSNASYAPVIDAIFSANPQIAGRFTLSRTVATVAHHSNLMLQITLTTTWRGYDGTTQSRSHTTYYGQGGLHAYFVSQS